MNVENPVNIREIRGTSLPCRVKGRPGQNPSVCEQQGNDFIDSVPFAVFVLAFGSEQLPWLSKPSHVPDAAPCWHQVSSGSARGVLSGDRPALQGHVGLSSTSLTWPGTPSGG